jgi:hypothetical protein
MLICEDDPEQTVLACGGACRRGHRVHATRDGLCLEAEMLCVFNQKTVAASGNADAPSLIAATLRQAFNGNVAWVAPHDICGPETTLALPIIRRPAAKACQTRHSDRRDQGVRFSVLTATREGCGAIRK